MGITNMTYKELVKALEAAGVELASAEEEYLIAANQLNKAEDEFDRINELYTQAEIAMASE